jgi:hypothetical protein
VEGEDRRRWAVGVFPRSMDFALESTMVHKRPWQLSREELLMTKHGGKVNSRFMIIMERDNEGLNKGRKEAIV